MLTVPSPSLHSPSNPCLPPGPSELVVAFRRARRGSGRLRVLRRVLGLQVLGSFTPAAPPGRGASVRPGALTAAATGIDPGERCELGAGRQAVGLVGINSRARALLLSEHSCFAFDPLLLLLVP